MRGLLSWYWFPIIALAGRLVLLFFEGVVLSHLFNVLFFFYTEALSPSDVSKLKAKVVDAIPPVVFEDMSVSQLRVSVFM